MPSSPATVANRRSATSQLRTAAQEQAKIMRGFDAGHVSILSNETVIGTVLKILEPNSQ